MPSSTKTMFSGIVKQPYIRKCLSYDWQTETWISRLTQLVINVTEKTNKQKQVCLYTNFITICCFFFYLSPIATLLFVDLSWLGSFYLLRCSIEIFKHFKSFVDTVYHENYIVGVNIYSHNISLFTRSHIIHSIEQFGKNNVALPNTSFIF